MKCKILCVAAIWVAGAHAAFASDHKLTAEADALRDRLLTCWRIPVGVMEANLETSVRFSLNPDGSLRGKPTITTMAPGKMGKAAADSAVAAIEKCAPYANAAKLGPDDITVDFDPDMH